jgi:hypothetical protein
MSLSPDIVAAVRATRIFADGSFSVDDQPATLPQGRNLVDALRESLYINFYCGGRSLHTHGPLDPGMQREFIAALSTANQSRSGWDAGWQIVAAQSNGVAIEKYGLQLFAPKTEVVAVSWEPGALAQVAIGRELRDVLPGYYMAIGETRDETSAGVLRIYWNVTPRGAVALMAMATGELNARSLPFRFKVLSHPQAYARSDAAILYVPLSIAGQVCARAQSWRETLGSDLRERVPRFTYRLSSGVALAKDPANGESFGQWVCRLIATALWQAHSSALPSDERLRAVEDFLVEQGVDPAHPHCLARLPVDQWPTTSPAVSAPTAADCIEEARSIGHWLCERAFWFEDRANWVGRVPNESDTRFGIVPTVAPMDGDLYTGTAGIARFLAQLYRIDGSDNVRRAALGAIRHALVQARQHSTHVRWSMYTGTLGVALAALSVGDACADAAITEAARAMASSVIANPPGDDTLLDYLVGAAGGIVALLRLVDMTGEPAFLDSAVAASELICSHAQRTQGMAAWNNRRAGGFDSGGRPLTGLAHGAAGMGIALLEVAARTQRSDFYDVGAEAFAYEDSLLDRALGNWPDLRASTPSFGVAWCHGAAGIGLSRLRALRLFGPSAPNCWAGAAEIALTTTRKTIERCDASTDATPCHGLAGLLEVLVSASQVLGDSQLLALARESWRRVAQDRAGRQWCCGMPSRRPTPGLMLGLSGVGWTCLRLHDPSITESVLI